MLVAVTGTPGTGKSSVCDILAQRGYHVVDLDAAAAEMGLTEAGEDGAVVVEGQVWGADTMSESRH